VIKTEQKFTLHYNTRSLTRKKSIDVITLSVIDMNCCEQIEKDIKNLFENIEQYIESTNNVIHKFISHNIKQTIEKLKELWIKYQSEIPFLIRSNFGIFCQ